VDYDGITVSIFRWHDIKKETKGIKHGCLNIGNERGTGKKVGIPEWKCSVGQYVVSKKLFYRVKVQYKVGPEKGFVKVYDFTKKYQYRYAEEKNGKEY